MYNKHNLRLAACPAPDSDPHTDLLHLLKAKSTYFEQLNSLEGCQKEDLDSGKGLVPTYLTMFENVDS